jgi:hypothetical protein
VQAWDHGHGERALAAEHLGDAAARAEQRLEVLTLGAKGLQAVDDGPDRIRVLDRVVQCFPGIDEGTSSRSGSGEPSAAPTRLSISDSAASWLAAVLIGLRCITAATAPGWRT